jgi:hypothetical protein
MLREALNFLLRESPIFSIKKRPISEHKCKDNIQNNVRIGLPHMQHNIYENITSADYENNHIYGTNIAPELARENKQKHSILEDRPKIVLRTADAYAYKLNTDKYNRATGLNTVTYGNFI